jgi:hypothetical protein
MSGTAKPPFSSRQERERARACIHPLSHTHTPTLSLFVSLSLVPENQGASILPHKLPSFTPGSVDSLKHETEMLQVLAFDGPPGTDTPLEVAQRTATLIARQHGLQEKT